MGVPDDADIREFINDMGAMDIPGPWGWDWCSKSHETRGHLQGPNGGTAILWYEGRGEHDCLVDFLNATAQMGALRPSEEDMGRVEPDGGPLTTFWLAYDRLVNA